MHKNLDLERKMEKAFRESDWLTLCAAARILISLTEGFGHKPSTKKHSAETKTWA